MIATLAIAATACTPTQITEAFNNAGIEISDTDAGNISEWTEQQDCLPNRNQPQYLECGIADSWLHYGLAGDGITLRRWAEVAACESGFDPDVTNRASGALGLYQHLPRYWQGRVDESGWGDDWANPRVNAFVSAMLASDAGGLSPWNASQHCWAGVS